MLTFTRRNLESIRIGDDVIVTVTIQKGRNKCYSLWRIKLYLGHFACRAMMALDTLLAISDEEADEL